MTISTEKFQAGPQDQAQEYYEVIEDTPENQLLLPLKPIEPDILNYNRIFTQFHTLLMSVLSLCAVLFWIFPMIIALRPIGNRGDWVILIFLCIVSFILIMFGISNGIKARQ